METLRTEVIEDGGKRDQRGRRILPPERIEALVSEYRASGLTQAAFARRGAEVSDVVGMGERASGSRRAVMRQERGAISAVATVDGADGPGGVDRVTA